MEGARELEERRLPLPVSGLRPRLGRRLPCLLGFPVHLPFGGLQAVIVARLHLAPLPLDLEPVVVLRRQPQECLAQGALDALQNAAAHPLLLRPLLRLQDAQKMGLERKQRPPERHEGLIPQEPQS